MALFQTSVLKTYLAQQDTAIVERAYKKYTKYFHNATRRISKTLKKNNTRQSFWTSCLLTSWIIP